MLTPNAGSVDRAVRIIVGLILIVTGFFVVAGTTGIILGLIGFVPLITGLVGWCPAYIPCNINTRK